MAIFEERVYSVLAVTGGTLSSMLPSMMPEAMFSPLSIVSSASEAKQKLAERSFDIIMVNMPLPDESGFGFALDAVAETKSAVMLLASSDLYGEVYTPSVSNGIILIRKPVSRSMLSESFTWLAAVRERLRASEKREMTIEEKMAEIKIVNRAKWILIDRYDLSEPDAHRYIEKNAMDNGISKRAAADRIIAAESQRTQ